jgi:hypothetical protein
MGTLNVPQAEAAVIKSIDTQHLSSLVAQCIRDEHGSGMRGLRLHECGPYVSARLYAFERALADYAAAKSAKKRESTGYDAYKTGSDLENAVGQMQHRVAIEEQERDRFFVDDQVMAPFSLHEELHVQVSFRWRDDIEAAWQYGSTTFSHTYVAPPDYRQRTLARKPSAARQARDRQEELFREWEHLRDLGLQAIRDHFRTGSGGAAIPKAVQARTDPHTGRLNNFSVQF